MLSLHTTPPLMFSSARLSSPRLGFLLRRQRRRRKRPRLPKPENPVPYHSYILFHHLRPSLRLSKLRLCHHVYDRRGWSLSTDGEICSCGSACSDLDSAGYRDRFLELQFSEMIRRFSAECRISLYSCDHAVPRVSHPSFHPPGRFRSALRPSGRSPNSADTDTPTRPRKL